jgi:hypothetical protein
MSKNDMSNSSSDRKQRRSQPKKISKLKRFFKWLESRFATPEFIGGMYTALTLFFFMAATNTLSGWLYVISGVSLALLIGGGDAKALTRGNGGIAIAN